MKERTSPTRKWRGRQRASESGAVKPLVLYVEDNRLNRLIMSKVLGDRHEVLLATNDREACDLLRRHQDQLHYILMDIELQGSILNGIELARLINGKPIEQPLPDYARELPVIGAPLLFVTAYSEQCDFMVFDLNSVVGVFHKPIHSQKLLDMMATLA